jgi:hypothetical protein
VAKWCSGGGERVSPVCVVLCVCACGGVCVVHVWLHVGQATAFAESPDLGLSVKSRTRWAHGLPHRRPNSKKHGLRREPKSRTLGEERDQVGPRTALAETEF